MTPRLKTNSYRQEDDFILTSITQPDQSCRVNLLLRCKNFKKASEEGQFLKRLLLITAGISGRWKTDTPNYLHQSPRLLQGADALG